MAYQVSKARFAELVERAMAELPDPFAGFMEEVRVEIEDRPSPKLLRQLDMDEDELLLGLYHGRSLLERSVEDSGRMPDVITIFQDDVEEVSDSEADLLREVRVTVLHEIGHFFGMNEDDLDNLGYG
jgi:predicted Zn-dependent protease with MMP-like domain